ncbi:MAG: glycerophosphodiester phosphodiesterase [Pseudomonadota bacterium]
MRTLTQRLLLAMTLTLPALSACGGSDDTPPATVIGHRGASALRPEHTLAAYQKAIDDGADFIEPDLVITSDGVLVARHENEIATTTDVASRPEFAARRTTKTIDGTPLTGWFTEDFTLAELKTLRAIERIPLNRPANVAFNGQFPVPTLQEVIDLAQQASRQTGRTIGIYPETKHPTFFQSIGKPLEQPLLNVLARNGYTEANSPVYIQSFEVANLRALRSRTRVKLVQLYGGPTQKPYDFVVANDPRTYGDMATAAGLREVASYAQGVGPVKDLVIPRDANNNLGTPTAFVANAHANNLVVHIYTLRPENPFLPANLRRGNVASPSERGDLLAEIRAYLDAGVDGFFTDDPAIGRAAVTAQTR